MLYENISYPHHLPFRICFSNVAEENYHYHKELEMSFILRGTTHYKIHHLDYSLKEGQIIIVDDSDLHRIHDSSPDLLALTIHMDLSYFSDIYPDIDSSIFVCEAMDEKDVLEYQELQNKNKILKRMMTKLMIAYTQEVSNDILLSYAKNLISILVEQFQNFIFSETSFKHDKRLLKDIDMQRYLKISNYLYTNYQERITLETMSEYLHLSPYYISHLVKYVSGLNFKNYLNYVRIEFSEKFLAEQTLTLTDICETCGFSSLTYFNKCFAMWHKKTPAQYRKDLPTCTRQYANSFSETEAFSILTRINDSYKITNQKPEETISTTSALIVDFKADVGVSFAQKYSIEILISSYEDLLFLNRYKEDALSLHPVGFVIKKNFLKNMTVNMKTATMIFLDNLKLPITERADEDCFCTPFSQTPSSHMKQTTLPSKLISFSEESTRLVYKNGLLSPMYHILRIIGNVSGHIVAEKSNYILTNDEKTAYLLIYKTASHQESYFTVSFKNTSAKLFITELHFENNNKYTDILNEFAQMKTIPKAILDEINTSFYNKKTYTLENASKTLSISLLKTGVILLKIVKYH